MKSAVFLAMPPKNIKASGKMQPAKVIPEKLFFKIGEVCELVEVQPHVLRYWESEFPMLTPQKNRAGQRTYRRKDVEIIMRIKQLLYDEGFTIAGAKKKLASELRGGTKLKVVTAEMVQETAAPIKEAPLESEIVLTPQQLRMLRRVKRELQGLLTMLSKDAIIDEK
ncbi:MAG: MerR family transcriptional regulator [Acidobacteriota bacterium]